MTDIEYTPNLGLAKQPTGAREWGMVLNENFDKIDQGFGKVVDWTNITNCITEIPQDIKLEVIEGNLTLKAGSKIYVPNGFEADGVTPKFDVVVISGDMTGLGWVSASTNDYIVFYAISGIIDGTRSRFCTSGTSYPSSPSNGDRCYRTDLNKIYVYRTGSSSWEEGESLPLGIVRGAGTAGKVGSIDQVFNGFGYIGSTVFALPGVKGLIPDGRNEDGTLNNIEVVTQKVLTSTFASTLTTQPNTARVLINQTGTGLFARIGSFDAENNYILGANGVEKLFGCIFAENGTVTNGVVNSFDFKLPFRAADDQEVVKASGNQTIDGIKTFTKGTASIKVSRGDATYGEIMFTKNDGTRTGGVRNIQESQGNTTMIYVASDDGNSIKGSINVVFDGTTARTSAPTPAVSDNSAQIATTNYVNQKVQLVSALPSSPNTNVFYFIPG